MSAHQKPGKMPPAKRLEDEKCDGHGQEAHRLPGRSSTAKMNDKTNTTRKTNEERRQKTLSTNHSLRRHSSAPDGAAADADAAAEATKTQALQITMIIMMMMHDAFTTLTSTINTSQ
jgi:hypothetical protein